MSTTLAEGAERPRRGALRIAAATLTGTVFGAGLATAQMTDPRKVLNFLDLAGAWDPSLLCVLGGAVVVALVGYRIVLRRSAPLLDDAWHLPQVARPDVALVAGSVLFGIGWGLAGYCPGPAIASIALGNPEAAWFVPAMLAGALLQRWQRRKA